MKVNQLLVGIIFIIVIGMIGVFKNPIYSGADEAAHFDYINHIIQHKKLPLLDSHINYEKLNIPNANPNSIPTHDQHEAVQPPLYYIIAAMLGSLFENVYLRLIFLRTLGVVAIAISFYFAHKTYQFMTKRDLLLGHHSLFLVISLLLISSPSFQRIMIPLNNEHLLLVLVSILTYKLVKYLGTQSFSIKQSVILGVLVGALILTKITAAYIAMIIAIIFIWKKWVRQLFIVGGISFIMVLPWIWFNFIHYQSLTGSKRHIEIVSPIVNPDNYSYTFLDILRNVPDFITTIWFWVGRYPLDRILNDFLSFTFFLAIIFVTLKLKENLNFIFLLFILGNLSLLIIVTLTTPIFTLLGRYMFMNYVSSAMILFIFITNVVQEHKYNWVMYLFGISGFVLTINHILDLLMR